MEKIIYIADISQDIDDLMAINFLKEKDRLLGVVLDGKSRDEEREKILIDSNIKMFDAIPEGTKTVFCGGALTKIAEYLAKGFKLDQIVVNGFFAGCDLVPEEHVLPKFKNQLSCRSYNPGLDPGSALDVLESGTNILVVSKNVCHNPNNVRGKWHEENFDCPERKLLHDVLMAKEGLNLIDNKEMLCEYCPVMIYYNALSDKWSSTYFEQSNVKISIFYKK